MCIFPISALNFNAVCTARLVSASLQANVQRFIYLSTAHIYGNPLQGLITEETLPTNYHPYATSKLAGEKVVLHSASLGTMKTIVLRLQT